MLQTMPQLQGADDDGNTLDGMGRGALLTVHSCSDRTNREMGNHTSRMYTAVTPPKYRPGWEEKQC